VDLQAVLTAVELQAELPSEQGSQVVPTGACKSLHLVQEVVGVAVASYVQVLQFSTQGIQVRGVII